jgi:hypothetical protein
MSSIEAKGFTVRYDENDNSFVISKNGNIAIFSKTDGKYVCPISELGTFYDYEYVYITTRNKVMKFDSNHNKVPITNNIEFNTPIIDDKEIAENMNLVDNNTTKNNTKYNKEQIARAHQTRQLHTDLGHVNDDYLKSMIDNGLILDCALVPKDIDMCNIILGKCTQCIQAKHTEIKNKTSQTPPADNPGEYLVMDMAFIDCDIGKKCPYMICIDEYTGFILGKRLNSKQMSEIKSCIHEFIQYYKDRTFNTKRILCDREKSFVSMDRINGTQLVYTAPSQHASRCERAIRTLKDIMRTTITSLPYKLHPKLYPRLMEYAIQRRNIIINTNSRNGTPNQIINNSKISYKDISHTTFGRIAFFHIPSCELQNNMSIRSELGIVVGYESNNMKNLKVLIVDREEIVTRNKYIDTIISVDMIKAINNIYKPIVENIVQIPHEVGLMAHDNNNDSMNDGNLTIEKAYNIIDKTLVDNAIKKEIDNMNNMNVWTLIDKIDISNINANIIPCKMFIKQKYLPDGSLDKVKARLVAGGHKQTEYDEVFAPTININILYMLLSINTVLKGKIVVTDVPTAYLHATLNDDIYMRINKNIVNIMNVHDKYISNQGDIVVKLNKCLYGLKQSGHVWHNTICKILMDIGFVQCSKEKCMFYNNKDGYNIIMIHVDDILSIFQSENMEMLYKNRLMQMFQGIQFQYDIISYLGVAVESGDSGVVLHQSGYVKKMLNKFEEATLKEYNMPSGMDFFETVDEENFVSDPNNIKKFKSMLMSLMFLATRTRPDIIKEVTYLATIVNPGPIAFQKLYRIMGYIKKTQHHVL